MVVQKTSIQKTYEMYIRFDSINVDFLGSNRQFDWLEISLVNDKSDKHTIHDSYNVELAAKYIKSIKAQQTKKKLIDNNSIDNVMQKHYLYKKFVAWNCDGCSVAPLTSYIHNPIYQELIDKSDYLGDKNHKTIKVRSGYTDEMEKLEKSDSDIQYFIYQPERSSFQKA